MPLTRLVRAVSFPRMRRTVGSLALATGLVILVPLAAPARDSFDASVSIKVEGEAIGVPTALYGRVRSAKEACERHRKVRVIRRNEGETTIYGRDATDAAGRWRVAGDPTVGNGTYRAVAAMRRISAGRCAKARSDSVFLD